MSHVKLNNATPQTDLKSTNKKSNSTYLFTQPKAKPQEASRREMISPVNPRSPKNPRKKPSLSSQLLEMTVRTTNPSKRLRSQLAKPQRKANSSSNRTRNTWKKLSLCRRTSSAKPSSNQLQDQPSKRGTTMQSLTSENSVSLSRAKSWLKSRRTRKWPLNPRRTRSRVIPSNPRQKSRTKTRIPS